MAIDMKEDKLHINHNRMPFVEALEQYKEECFVPFHTPGHKLGVGAPKKLQQWMDQTLAYDLGLMYALDDYHEPEGAYKEALELAAHLYGAYRTWFSVNGTTGAIHMMMLGVLREGDTIVLPREAHGSVQRGLILTGAKPVYLKGRFNARWGIPLGPTVDEVKEALDENPHAKALLLVHPNYYGIGGDLEAIIGLAHERGLVVLVDEAHGPHLPFYKGLPKSALACGADLVAQSTHKIVGSLTQTSMLHGQGTRIDYNRLDYTHQILMSTSPNYIFLASLDMARHQLAMEGEKLLQRAHELAQSLRLQLNDIEGISCPNLEDMEGAFSYDRTKVLIDFSGLQINGQEAELLLRGHHIEVELRKANHVLLIITLGDTEESIQAVINAVRQISEMARQVDGVSEGGQNPSGQGMDEASHALLEKLPTPIVKRVPRDAFYSDVEEVFLDDAKGRISGETIAYYPPGIPFLSIGEEITEEVIQYIHRHKNATYEPNGASDKTLKTIRVLVE